MEFGGAGSCTKYLCVLLVRWMQHKAPPIKMFRGMHASAICAIDNVDGFSGAVHVGTNFGGWVCRIALGSGMCEQTVRSMFDVRCVVTLNNINDTGRIQSNH